LDHASRNLSDPDFVRKTGPKLEDFRGKLVMDVVCGRDRFAEVASRWGARIVGIDLSAAAKVAAENQYDREFVVFLRESR
jgi:2-polyprenyl-3-methyl-5-hydroxy-6-metoxy-1,4-benzoquinol methylase